jgi:hypothetical protein
MCLFFIAILMLIFMNPCSTKKAHGVILVVQKLMGLTVRMGGNPRELRASLTRFRKGLV